MSTQQRKISRRIRRNIESGRIKEDGIRERGLKIIETIEKKRKLRRAKKEKRRIYGK